MGRIINLPKNIRQIGSDDSNRKVYIEDYVHSFIRDTPIDEFEDGAVGILLGDVSLDDELTYIFVRGAIEVTNAAVYADKIAFTEETWPILRSNISQYFAGLNIVGWYLVSSRITQDEYYVINKADAESFDDSDSVFFMVNPETGEDIFHEKTAKGLSPLGGYTVFYERNEKMQAYMSEYRGELPERERTEPAQQPDGTESGGGQSGGEYRKLAGEGNAKLSKSVKGHLTFIYALSMLLIIVVLVIGINAINRYDATGGNSGTPDAGKEVNADIKTTPYETVPVQSVVGDVTSSGQDDVTTEETTEPATEEATTPEPTTPEPTTPEPTTPEPTTPEPTTEAPPAYQVYTLQAGDTLLGICRKFYGRESMDDVQRILDYNGLSSSNDILVGTEIKIPN